VTPEREGRGKSHFTSEAQKAYNSRERSGYQAYVQANGPVKGGQKAFRKLLKARGWAVPSHGRSRPPSKKRQQAERAFVAEGLGRPERAEADSFKAIYG
jgi:hypothetical protein